MYSSQAEKARAGRIRSRDYPKLIAELGVETVEQAFGALGMSAPRIGRPCSVEPRERQHERLRTRPHYKTRDLGDAPLGVADFIGHLRDAGASRSGFAPRQELRMALDDAPNPLTGEPFDEPTDVRTDGRWFAEVLDFFFGVELSPRQRDWLALMLAFDDDGEYLLWSKARQSGRKRRFRFA